MNENETTNSIQRNKKNSEAQQLVHKLATKLWSRCNKHGISKQKCATNLNYLGNKYKNRLQQKANIVATTKKSSKHL